VLPKSQQSNKQIKTKLVRKKNHQSYCINNNISLDNRIIIMAIRELVNDLSLFEAKIRSLRLILNLPITQNRNLSVSEKDSVKSILNELMTLINKHLTEIS
jgi:hypothetical protein